MRARIFILLRGGMMYKTYELQNGLRIVCEYIGYVRSVSVGVFVKNGSRHDRRSCPVFHILLSTCFLKERKTAARLRLPRK